MPLYELKTYRAECDICHKSAHFQDVRGHEQAVPDGWTAINIHGWHGWEDYRFTCPDCQTINDRKEKENER